MRIAENASAHANAEELAQCVRTRGGFGSLEARLRAAPCTLAYAGASVTVQKEGYRPVLHQWFCDTFRQPHRSINAGWGGVGSNSAVFLMDELVISRQPDLCFIEYSTGDVGTRTPLREIGAAVEGMVRKLLAAGCEICFLYLYRNDQSFGAGSPVIDEYEKIATHYSLPSLNVGRLIEQDIAAGRFSIDELLSDTVHTTAPGSRVTMQYLVDGIESILSSSDPSRGGARVRDETSALHTRNYHHTEIVHASTQMLRQPENCVTGRFRLAYDFVGIDSTNEICFVPSGELVGLLVIIGPSAGSIEVESGGAIETYMLRDEWCTYNRLSTVMVRNPVDEGTTIIVRVVDKEDDPVRTKLNLVGFLVRKNDPE